MTYNTGNAVGSKDPRDLFDNAEAFDRAMNSPAAKFTDRRGVERNTLANFETLATGVPAVAASISAQAAQVAAESARDAAQLSAGVYADTAAGLAATTGGQYFSVPSSESGEYLILYRNNSGAAAEVKRYPSTDGLKEGVENTASSLRTPGQKIAYSRPVTGSYGLIAGFTAWGLGFFPATSLISRINAQLQLSSLAVSARVRVYRRSGLGYNVPGNVSTDTLEREFVVDLLELAPPVAGLRRSVALKAVFEPLSVTKDQAIILSIEALDAQGNEAVFAIGTTPYVSGADVINQGYGHVAGGNWSLLGPTQPWPAVTVDDGDGEIDGIHTVAVGSSDIAYYETTATDWNRADFAGWAVTFPAVQGVEFDAVVANLGLITKNSTIQVRVFSRLLASAGAYGVPGSLSADLHHATRSFSASDLADTDQLTKVVLPVGPVSIDADRIPVIEITALKSDGTRGVLGAGKQTYSSAPTQLTWMLAAAGSGEFTLLLQNNAVSLGIARTLRMDSDQAITRLVNDSAKARDKGALHDSQIADLMASTLDVGVADEIVPKLEISGRTVNLAGSYAVLDGITMQFSGSFTLPRPATGTEVKTDYTLKYSANGAIFVSNPNALLWRRRLSNVVVTRKSDGVVLARGTDYEIDLSWGRPWGLINKADFLVDIAYTYERERYDLIQIDPVTLVASIVSGTERDLDAHEYLPTVGGRNSALFQLYVHEESVTAVPVYRFDNGVRRDSRAVFDSLMSNNKAALAKTLAKLRKGLPIKMVGYGHSIVQHGGNDLLWYFETVPADTKAAIPRYDRGDSGGPWAVKTSYLWVAKQAIEAAFGIVVDYINAGRSGTNSSSAANNGLDPARLGPVLASGADLMVLDFGMNEIGSDTTYANFKSIIQQAKAAGMEVVVMAVQGTNQQNDTRDIAGWRKTNRTLRIVAEDTKAAFCPTHWLTDQGGGGVPFAPEQFCSANFFNHPGITENRVYGEFLARMFL